MGAGTLFIVGSFVLVTDRGTFTIDLWGRGGAPVIDVEPPSLDFGSVPVGRHRDLPVTVRNLGEFPLHVTRSAEPGPFSLAPGEPADFSLPVGGSRSLSFRFLPDMIGRVARTDTLRTNTVEGMVRLPLRGSGGEEYALHLDTVSGAVGDTLRLHLLIDPSYDSSGRTVGWVARLRVDPHALRIIGPSAPNPLHVSMTRLGDDTVRLAGLSSIPRDGILATIDILGLSTALPVNSVRLLDVVSDSLAVVAGWDGLVLLSGCIIGNAAPLERRSAILGLRWDASGALTVRYRLPGSATGRVRVVDMLAREVARAAVPGPGDQEREIVLPMTGLPRGIYFVELLVADDRSIMPVMGGG